MALSEEQLEIISDAMLPLFQYLESQVIIDVAKRIKNTMSLTRTSEIMAESMQRLGYSPAKIRQQAMKLLKADPAFQKEVAENTLAHKKKVKELLEEVRKEFQKRNDTLTADCGDMSYFDDEKKEWLKDQGFATDLTAEEIAELEVQTFYPTTNILNDANCGMEVTYKADTKNYIDKIIGERVSALESAMINNI